MPFDFCLLALMLHFPAPHVPYDTSPAVDREIYRDTPFAVWRRRNRDYIEGGAVPFTVTAPS